MKHRSLQGQLAGNQRQLAKPGAPTTRNRANLIAKLSNGAGAAQARAAHRKEIASYQESGTGPTKRFYKAGR